VNDSWHGKASAFSAYWQLPLLRVMLRSTGISGVVSPLVSVAFWGAFRAEFLLALATGVFLLALSFTKLERGRLVASIYVGVALVTALFFGARFGWMPDVVAVLSYLIVAAGVLFGPQLVYVIVALVAGLLLLGGFLVRAGACQVSLSPQLNPAVSATWLRTALGFALLTGSAAWVLRKAVATVSRAEEEAVQALTQARDRLKETQASRARRLREEQALLDAQKLQSVAQLGDGFAHVVSNALTIVRCACEDARKLASDAARRSAATAIRHAVSDCANRTRDLLLLSRPHSLLPVSVELHREVRAQAQNLEQRLRGNVRAHFDLEPAGSVLVPPSWVPQILTNLLLNAEAAIRGGGTIRISTRRVEFSEDRTSTIDRLPAVVHAALEVVDDGEGMTPEVMAHACEPFFTTRGRAGHDGLGLTLVHSMLRQVGGTLGLASDGRGSTVTLYFPLAPAVSASSESSVSEPPVAASPPPPSVTAPRASAPEPLPSGPPGHSTVGTRAQLSEATRKAVATLKDPGWRITALGRTARIAALASLAAAVASILFPRDPEPIATLLILAACPLLMLASSPRLPYRLRLMLVLGAVLGTGVVFVLWYSFMGPGAVAAITQAVFLATLFGNRRIALSTLLLATLVFIVGGAVWQGTSDAGALQQVLFDDAGNWFRIGVTLPAVLLVNGYTVLEVFRLAAERVPALERARRELEHRQEQHHTETEAFVRAENIRGRAERTATAGRVTGVVAHDLNNSLMALLGWAELLEESDPADEALENLEQAVEHAEALLQTLRGTTVLDHRGPGLDLAAALGRTRAMLEAVWQTEASQRCSLELQSDPECFVEIQEGSFRRLLVNLVTNARHALAESAGSCTVRVRQDTHDVTLSVVDTGPGMDGATQRRIFEPFFTTKPDTGTGLGLLSVSEIVSATGGALEVQSEPGHGSTFAIRWPLAAPGALQARDSSPPPSAGSAARVLLAEDEPIVRRLLAHGLRSQGYEVVEAEDGDAAMRLLDEHGPFDALCTDAVMPGRSVFELISQYQAARPRGLVVVLSGYLPENLAPLFGRAGVRLLRKPFSHSVLAAELERLRRKTA